MNDIEQSASSSTPIAPTTYPKLELSSPQLRAYAQWHSASQVPSTSSPATSVQSPNAYGQSFSSSLSVISHRGGHNVAAASNDIDQPFSAPTTQLFDTYLRSNATLVSNDDVSRSGADSHEYPSPHDRPILNR
ncbi:hypothetical protein PIIN_03704 [Serendipita indica DSM 11827]|uniref:Uncharacterized protein n=1 Tax=Serendipita indica (strain DSM 11827) TaxID=1109443 RepID=G4TEM1_SERID|nr:hypothetical protein PIIN_03704 [Serendipita indica DSM 11827]